MAHLRPCAWALALVACGDGTSTSPPRDASTEATTDAVVVDVSATNDAANDVALGHAERCAATFGSALTEGFGRLDGVVRAVVTPADTQCAMPNNDHVVLQIDLAGAAHRMVINVSGSRGTDRRVYLRELTAPLPPPAFAAGWHAPAQLDYGLSLDATPASFMPYEMNPLVDRLVAALPVGARVSVYATSGAGRPDSTHLIHRNGNDSDGALVVNPDGPSPRWLLFRFADQSW